MKIFPCVVLAPLSFLAATVAAHAGYEYDWTGGQTGYSGTIILDSSSSSDGSLSDIVSATITDPMGTFDYAPSLLLEGEVDGGLQPFTWDATDITSMWIDWYNSTSILGQITVVAVENFIYGPPANFDGSTETFGGDPTFYDTSGSWTGGQYVATPSVSDASSSLALLGFGLCMLAAARRLVRQPALS